MNPKRPFFSHPSGTIMIVLLCMASCLLVAGACAADVYVTGYLGDIIDMHGSWYRGTQVYLFMTGPGLPTDGVTLTDVTQRADQGQFTIVELDSSQQWWFNWDTSRIWNEINPGTYTVYVSTEPVDYSHLGGSDTYKTLSVYLQDPENRKGGSSRLVLHSASRRSGHYPAHSAIGGDPCPGHPFHSRPAADSTGATRCYHAGLCDHNHHKSGNAAHDSDHRRDGRCRSAPVPGNPSPVVALLGSFYHLFSLRGYFITDRAYLCMMGYGHDSNA